MGQYWDWFHVACSFHRNRGKVFPLRAKKKELCTKEFLKGIILRRKENSGWHDYPEESLKEQKRIRGYLFP